MNTPLFETALYTEPSVQDANFAGLTGTYATRNDGQSKGFGVNVNTDLARGQTFLDALAWIGSLGGRIQLGAGVYGFTGCLSLPSNITIAGRSMFGTVLQLQPTDTFWNGICGTDGKNPGGTWFMFMAWQVNAGGTYIEDLTIDCNWPAIYAATGFRNKDISGCALVGRNIGFRRVRCINYYGWANIEKITATSGGQTVFNLDLCQSPTLAGISCNNQRWDYKHTSIDLSGATVTGMANGIITQITLPYSPTQIGGINAGQGILAGDVVRFNAGDNECFPLNVCTNVYPFCSGNGVIEDCILDLGHGDYFDGFCAGGGTFGASPVALPCALGQTIFTLGGAMCATNGGHRCISAKLNGTTLLDLDSATFALDKDFNVITVTLATGVSAGGTVVFDGWDGAAVAGGSVKRYFDGCQIINSQVLASGSLAAVDTSYIRNIEVSGISSCGTGGYHHDTGGLFNLNFHDCRFVRDTGAGWFIYCSDDPCTNLRFKNNDLELLHSGQWGDQVAFTLAAFNLGKASDIEFSGNRIRWNGENGLHTGGGDACALFGLSHDGLVSVVDGVRILDNCIDQGENIFDCTEGWSPATTVTHLLARGNRTATGDAVAGLADS